MGDTRRPWIRIKHGQGRVKGREECQGSKKKPKCKYVGDGKRTSEPQTEQTTHLTFANGSTLLAPYTLPFNIFNCPLLTPCVCAGCGAFFPFALNALFKLLVLFTLPPLCTLLKSDVRLCVLAKAGLREDGLWDPLEEREKRFREREVAVGEEKSVRGLEFGFGLAGRGVGIWCKGG